MFVLSLEFRRVKLPSPYLPANVIPGCIYRVYVSPLQLYSTLSVNGLDRVKMSS